MVHRFILFGMHRFILFGNRLPSHSFIRCCEEADCQTIEEAERVRRNPQRPSVVRNNPALRKALMGGGGKDRSGMERKQNTTQEEPMAVNAAV